MLGYMIMSQKIYQHAGHAGSHCIKTKIQSIQ